ncbi:MAG: hypothetical protein V3T33_07265 [Myxococcota bacterium]
MKRTCASLLLACAFGCAGAGPIDPEQLEASDPDASSLVRLALDFYDRISNRRFNSIATYRDPALREFFQTPEAFADYYAELAQVLGEAHFQANRPTRIELEAIRFDGDATARLIVRFRGDNARPLRWWRTAVVREEVWKREQGRWWIIPGKL